MIRINLLGRTRPKATRTGVPIEATEPFAGAAPRFTTRGNSWHDPEVASACAAECYSRNRKLSRTRPTSIRSPSLSLVKPPIWTPLIFGTRSPRPK